MWSLALLYLSKIHLTDRNFLLCVHKLRIEFQKKIFAQYRVVWFPNPLAIGLASHLTFSSQMRTLSKYRATIHFHFLISQFLSVQLSVQTSRRWSHHQCILGTYLQRIQLLCPALISHDRLTSTFGAFHFINGSCTFQVVPWWRLPRVLKGGDIIFKFSMVALFCFGWLSFPLSLLGYLLFFLSQAFTI